MHDTVVMAVGRRHTGKGMKVKVRFHSKGQAYDVPPGLRGELWRLGEEYEVLAIERQGRDTLFLIYHFGWRWVGADDFVPASFCEEYHLLEGYEEQSDFTWRKKKGSKGVLDKR